MNRTLTTVLYVVLVLCTLWFGYSFYKAYVKVQPSPQEEAGTDGAGRESVGRVNFSGANQGRVGLYGALLFASVLGIGVLLAHDFSRFFAGRVEKFVFNDDLEGVKDPAYDEAEHVWANGRHLEAIQLMRDHLKKHPMEQYVALRIAEIYEKDLGNYLAAALEYEEVLKKKLPAERWGWAAIHLANLYSGKLNKTQAATDLLQRIVDEYGQTGAAKKARERLGLPEPRPETAVSAEPPSSAASKEESSPSNLPPGFRPK